MGVAGIIEHANGEQLAGIVPFIDGGGLINALVTLQPDQPCLQNIRQCARDLGFAHTRLAFQQQRFLAPNGQVERCRQPTVSDVGAGGERAHHVVDAVQCVWLTQAVRVGYASGAFCWSLRVGHETSPPADTNDTGMCQSIGLASRIVARGATLLSSRAPASRIMIWYR